MEYNAPSALLRILLNNHLWPHFCEDHRIAIVLGAAENERGEMWGDIIDPNDAGANFGPRYIFNSQLGAP
jgi:hypothetical protein